VPDYLSIGDFSRATHMTVKTLRHYHQIGLLEPAEVDPCTGYRRYSTDQIPAAQVVSRFRELGMPLEEIQGVLSAPDLQARNERTAASKKNSAAPSQPLPRCATCWHRPGPATFPHASSCAACRAHSASCMPP
jgi:DNA-binding transcriptional MerR regulator